MLSRGRGLCSTSSASWRTATSKFTFRRARGLRIHCAVPEERLAPLAAAVAMIDDIEPHDASSPETLFVAAEAERPPPVDPGFVRECVRVARQSIADYRSLRESGLIEDMSSSPLVLSRVSEFLRAARAVVADIEATVPNPFAAEGLSEIVESGYLRRGR